MKNVKKIISDSYFFTRKSFTKTLLCVYIEKFFKIKFYHLIHKLLKYWIICHFNYTQDKTHLSHLSHITFLKLPIRKICNPLDLVKTM